MGVVADRSQEHELEGECREVVVKEEDAREEVVRQVVGKPAEQQHQPAHAPLLKHICEHGGRRETSSECMRKGRGRSDGRADLMAEQYVQWNRSLLMEPSRKGTCINNT